MSDDKALDEAKRMVLERRKAVAAWKAFLESTPPNVSVTIPHLLGRYHPKASGNPLALRFVEVELFCEHDDGPRLFSTRDDYLFPKPELSSRFVTYVCKNCEEEWKIIAFVYLQKGKADSTTAEVMKLGQYPPFGAPVSKRVGKLLGDGDLDLYRKGLRSESQGLGIGAATYFRRIVDNQWKSLVSEIREVAAKLGERDLSLFDAALREQLFSKAVDMLSGAIPPRLKILGGENPLTLLYRPLSVGLHALSDEECLQQAADIRVVLTALLENIADVLKDQDELKHAVSRLKKI